MFIDVLDYHKVFTVTYLKLRQGSKQKKQIRNMLELSVAALQEYSKIPPV